MEVAKSKFCVTLSVVVFPFLLSDVSFYLRSIFLLLNSSSSLVFFLNQARSYFVEGNYTHHPMFGRKTFHVSLLTLSFRRFVDFRILKNGCLSKYQNFVHDHSDYFIILLTWLRQFIFRNIDSARAPFGQ